MLKKDTLKTEPIWIGHEHDRLQMITVIKVIKSQYLVSPTFASITAWYLPPIDTIKVWITFREIVAHSAWSVKVRCSMVPYMLIYMRIQLVS